jgi:hypothetical protein
MKTNNAKKMDNLAEQAVKTDSVTGGLKGSAFVVPTPRPDPTIINDQISQTKEGQEPLGTVEGSNRATAAPRTRY